VGEERLRKTFKLKVVPQELQARDLSHDLVKSPLEPSAGG
jgi:hypothetical protein